jgi:hypothetical protein
MTSLMTMLHAFLSQYSFFPLFSIIHICYFFIVLSSDSLILSLSLPLWSWAHQVTNLLVYLFSSEFSSWLFFILSISLLKFELLHWFQACSCSLKHINNDCFTFSEGEFLHVCHLSVGICWFLFSSNLKFFSVLCMRGDFCLKPGHLGHYFMRHWILLNFLFWQSSFVKNCQEEKRHCIIFAKYGWNYSSINTRGGSGLQIAPRVRGNKLSTGGLLLALWQGWRPLSLLFSCLIWIK